MPVSISALSRSASVSAKQSPSMADELYDAMDTARARGQLKDLSAKEISQLGPNARKAFQQDKKDFDSAGVATFSYNGQQWTVVSGAADDAFNDYDFFSSADKFVGHYQEDL